MILAFENLTLTIRANNTADERVIELAVVAMYGMGSLARMVVPCQDEYEHVDAIEMYAQTAAEIVRQTLRIVEANAPTLEVTRVPDGEV